MINENDYKKLLHDSSERYLTIHEVRKELERCLEQAKRVRNLMNDNDISSPYDLNSIITSLQLMTNSMWTNDIF